MAITIISSPNQFQAAYNPIKYTIDSTNKNQPGFRYIVQIFDTGTSNLLAEMDVAPDPFDNGYGIVDVSRIVRNKVDKFLDLNSTTVSNAVGTFYRYDIKFGESYSTDWNFTDYGFNNDFIGGNTGLFQSPQTTPHNFVVGDQVYVETDLVYNDNRVVLTGYFTVIGVVNAYDIVINLNDVGSFPTTPGKVSFADNRKVRTYNSASFINRICLNVAQDIVEYSSVSGSMAAYEITTSSSAKLLTNVPSGFKVSPTQHMWLNQFVNTNGTTDSISVRFVNSNGETFVKVNSGNFIVKQNSIGPGNLGTLIPVSGATLPLIKADTEWYDVYINDDDGDIVTEIKRFYIDRRCPINDIEVVFMDRKGSFMSFYFPLKKFERITTEKEMYNKYVKTFTTSADGVQVYNSDYKKTLNLNTNYLTDDMNIYFEELLTSPYTYVRLEDKWYSCKIAAGNFETERTRNKRLVKRSIDIEFDINTPVNI